MVRNVIVLLVSLAFVTFVIGCSVLFIGCSAQSVATSIAPSTIQSVTVEAKEETSHQPLRNVNVIVDGASVARTDINGRASVNVPDDREVCISVAMDEWINTIGNVCARVGHDETWTFYLLHAE